MSSVYSSYTDPTSVSSSSVTFLINRHERSLIVGKKDLLQIYKIEEEEEDLSRADSVEHSIEDDVVETGDDFIGGAGMTVQTSEKQSVLRLILVTEHRFMGTIMSITTVRPKNFEATGLEYVLVAFEAAKLSLMAWNSDTYSLKTISIHSFERDEFRSPFDFPNHAKTRADPHHRVVTLSVFGKYMAFLPIAQRDELLIDESEMEETDHAPISGSFVLPVTQLEDDITQVIDFTYLDGYREPTMAILYSSQGTSNALASWRRNTVQLTVLTLDLNAGARTAIFEISNLPSDLQSIHMVPEPVGGCLSLGPNQIIYIDPASRLVALSVNKFAESVPGLSMRDYSHLNLRLEGALPVPLIKGNKLDGILIVLSDGRFGLITLNLDGRTVTSLHLKIVSDQFGGSIMTANASCYSVLDDQRCFIGSCVGNSILFTWRKRSRPSPSKEQSDKVIPVNDQSTTEEGQPDDLDDLYEDDITEKKVLGAETSTFDLVFYLHDTLRNPGSITGLSLGAPYSEETQEHQAFNNVVTGEIAIVGGSGRAGNLTLYRRSIVPDVIGQFESPQWQALWTVQVKSTRIEPDQSVATNFDKYLMASKATETQVFTIDKSFEEKTDSEFETADSTVAVGTLLDRSCIIQVCPDMMRTYDADLKVLELMPTPEGATIISASIIDPYVLLLLDDAKVALYSIQRKTKELQDVSHNMNKNARTQWATLHAPHPIDSPLGVLLGPSSKNRKRKRGQDDDSRESHAACLCFIVTVDGHLLIHQLPSMTVVFKSRELTRLPEVLFNQFSKNEVTMEAEPSQTKPCAIVEFVVTELGQRRRSPYLVVRNEAGMITIYQPFVAQDGSCHFKKLPNLIVPKLVESNEEEKGIIRGEPPKSTIHKPLMTICARIGEYSCLFINNPDPVWLLKSDQSLPTLHASGVRDIRSLSAFNTSDAEGGFICCDSQSVVRICRLPEGFTYENKWSSRSIPIGRNTHSIAYFAPQQVYAVLTSEYTALEIPDEDDEEWTPRQTDRESLPLFARGSVELIDVRNHQIIDRYEFSENEQAMSLKAVTLTIATDYSKKNRHCIAVSTGIFRGEDLAMRGAIYLFDVVEVVPELDHPESRYRLKNITREEVKAATTAVCEVDGYLLGAQGQKVIIRSLEEDERLTPVAFVDLGLGTTTAKCLRSMILFGDIRNGIRFVGFGEEPYKVTNFGRDYDAMDVMDAEFMVHGKTLYFVASDPVGNLRVLQYDPENSTTLAGSRLVRRSDIHAGHIISSMMLLPGPKATDPMDTKTGVLCAALDGSIGVLNPISERSYRRLYTVQAQIASIELQCGGLNPRAYRTCTVEANTGNPARGILDGNLLLTFSQMDVQAQAQLAQKSGVAIKNVMEDLGKLQDFVWVL